MVLDNNLDRPQPSLTDKFLAKGSIEIFCTESRATSYGSMSRSVSRAQFVHEIIGELERKHGMTTDVFATRFSTGELSDDRNVGDYVRWAGLAHVMERDVRRLTTRT